MLKILHARKLRQEFPLFFLYNGFAVVALILRFSAQPIYRFYFVVYWLTEAVLAVLGLLATLELFPHVFKAFSQVRQFRLVMLASVLLMAGVAIAHAIFKPPIQAGRLIAAIYSLEIAVRYVQAGIFVLFIVMAVFYAVQLRRYAFGIAFGFGLLAAGRLAAALLRSEFGTRFKFLFIYMPAVIYIIAVLVWLITFLKPEPPDPFEQIKSPLSPQEIIERIRRLTRALKGQRDDINLLASARRGSARARLSALPQITRRSPPHHS